MNLVTFGLILICCHAWAIEMDDNSSGRFFEMSYAEKTPIEEFLEKFKKILQHGNESLGIPPLDPATADELPLKMNGTLEFDEKKYEYFIDALLQDARADGISNYIVHGADLKFAGLELTVNMSWPLIIAKANYCIDAQFVVIPIYGCGQVDLTVINFNFDTKINLGLDGVYLKIAKMELNMSLSTFNLNVTGLYNDEELSEVASKFVSDLVVGVINSKGEIFEFIKKALESTCNDVLRTKTLMEWLELIGGINYEFNASII